MSGIWWSKDGIIFREKIQVKLDQWSSKITLLYDRNDGHNLSKKRTEVTYPSAQRTRELKH